VATSPLFRFRNVKLNRNLSQTWTFWFSITISKSCNINTGKYCRRIQKMK